MQRLGPAEKNGILAHFTANILPLLDLVEINSGHFQRAAEISNVHRLGIRAGDALHLAVAQDYGCPVCTFDQKLAAGAEQLGYAAELLT
jgi:predicted nucleic acid-binding protein